MADAAFATGSRAAAPISRSEQVSARSSSASSAQTSDFNRNLAADRSDSVNAVLRLHPANEQAAPPGRGLLSTGVQLLLAQTRTQEAAAPLPPVSNFERARSRYLATQASVRDTIAANSLLRGSEQAAPQAQLEAPAPAYAASQPSGDYPIDDEFDEDGPADTPARSRAYI